MRITAVVVNHNTSAMLPDCLDALLAQDHGELGVTVVDNASEDGVREVLAAYAGRIRTILSDRNRGYAGAINHALIDDDADAVLVCNPDVVPAPGHVTRLVAALDEDARRGSVQGKLLRPDGTIDSTGHVAFRSRLFHNRGEGDADDGRHDEAGPVFGVTGALALHRRAMLDDVAIELPWRARPELFDEDLFAYFEDVDLDWRAAMRGWVSWYEPRAVASHVRRGAQRGRSQRVEELNWSNRLLVLVKCDDAARLARAFPGVVATTLLKAAVLGVRHPATLARAIVRFLRLSPVMLVKRQEVQRRASVPSQVVAERWLETFSYRNWFAAFRRRQRQP